MISTGQNTRRFLEKQYDILKHFDDSLKLKKNF